MDSQPRLYCFVLVCILLLFFPNELRSNNDSSTPKNNYILIFSSYSYEHKWGTDVAKSIRSELERKDPNLLVHISYADVADKRTFLSGRFGMQAGFANSRLSSSMIIPDVLVFLGEEAWMYYRIMNLRGIWDKVPVVLTGVRSTIMEDYSAFFINPEIEDSQLIPLDKSYKNLPVHALTRAENGKNTLDLINALYPECKEIIFPVADNNYQDYFALHKIREYMAKNMADKKLRVLIEEKHNTDSIHHELSKAGKGSVLLLNTFRMPKDIHIPVFSISEKQAKGDNYIGGYYSTSAEYGGQVADLVLAVHNDNGNDSIPSLSIIRGAAFHLNKEALNHWNMTSKASRLDNVVWENIPPSFFVKYMRQILVSCFVFLLAFIICGLVVRNHRYKQKLEKILGGYKDLYSESQIVYENMPMGLIQLDLDGNVINKNPESDRFFHVISEKSVDFNLFKSSLIDSESKEKVRNREYVNQIYEYGEYFIRIILKYFQNEQENVENILMIVIDSTEVQKERNAKEKMYNIFTFAMNTSYLGLAEYNLIDGSGFATDAWYKNFNVPKNQNFIDIHHNIAGEDREKIEQFVGRVTSGNTDEVFTETLRVLVDGEIHWLRYIMQVMEFNPERNRIIVAGLVLNIDKQKQREAELAEAIAIAAESDRMKNAFIANMSSDIRPSLEELVNLSTELSHTVDMNKKQELMEMIEKNNGVLLQYIKDIIHLSQTESDNLNS